jgi:hypothetical protein
MVKPNAVDDAGDLPDNYKYGLESNSNLHIVREVGTSFAAPLALRKAVIIWLLSGQLFNPSSIKCVLIHYSDPTGLDRIGCGWGLLPDVNFDFPSDNPTVFQVLLNPGFTIVFDINLPEGTSENVEISLTTVVITPVSQYNIATYAKSAIQIHFLPDRNAPMDKNGNIPWVHFFDTAEGFSTENLNPFNIVMSPEKSNKNVFSRKDLNNPGIQARFVDRTTAPDVNDLPVKLSIVVTVKNVPDTSPDD